eukprot:tig00000093_g3532.t1
MTRNHISREMSIELAPVIAGLSLIYYTSEVVVGCVILLRCWEMETSQPLHEWLMGRICMQALSILTSLFALAVPSVREDPIAELEEDELSDAPGSPGTVRSESPPNAMDNGEDGRLPGTPPRRRPGRPRSPAASCFRSVQGLLCIFAVAWWVFGVACIYRCPTCKVTAYPLYTLCIVLLSLSFAAVALPFLPPCLLCFCLPCLLPLMFFAARLAPNSAQRLQATSEQVEAVPKAVFAPGLMPEEDASCVMCMEAYEPGAELRQLPCRHFFHRGCIDRWLAIKRTCPLCLHDITETHPAAVVV